jgi:hypothetical protein
MPQYWFIVEALVALAAHRKDARKPFTRADLKAWSKRFGERPSGVQQALDHLERCGMVRRLAGAPSDRPLKPGTWRYVLTAEGAAAAKAAREARGRAAMSRGGTKANKTRPRDTSSYTARLWSLLRMRRTLTAADAAATLVDAGDDVIKAARTASKYLRGWARLHPAAVQISAQRCRTGGFRFVLVQDLGPEAPVIPKPPAIPNKRAQGGAVA